MTGFVGEKSAKQRRLWPSECTLLSGMTEQGSQPWRLRGIAGARSLGMGVAHNRRPLAPRRAGR